MAGKRFAVLLCAEDSDYMKKQYGGYFGLFVRMLGEEGEEWDVYRVSAGEIPDDDVVCKYDGFVITGSCSDAHGNDVWICKLLVLLKKLDSMKKKVLGICFGHQILSRALGGKIGRAKSGWDIGVTVIKLSSSSTSNLLSSLKLPSVLSIIECHQDEVYELPAKAQVIGRSDHTGVEMFTYGDHMMGIQGHPEYTQDILLHLIDRLLQRNFIVESYAEKMKTKIEVCKPDVELWKRLCINFLKN